MSEINVDVLITNVLNSMSGTLTDEQLKKLKDNLYINLHDIEISNKCYDLAETIQENDTKKMEYFIASSKVDNLSMGTIKQYIDSANKLRLFVGKNFKNITAIDIRFFLASYQKDHNWKDSTVQNNIRNLRAFFGFLYKEEIICKNPMDKIKSVKLNKPIRTAFSAIEMERLRLACRGNSRDIALIEFLNCTGLRVSELCTLKWCDLDMSRLRFTVNGKGNKERDVLFTEKAGFYLLRYLDERMTVECRTKEEIMDRPLFAEKKRNKHTKDYDALTDDGIRYLLKKIGKDAKINEIYPHKFRRTFATDAINKGMPLEELRILMGHSQYDTTLIYAQIKTSRIENTYRMLCE